jgi:protein TonB
MNASTRNIAALSSLLLAAVAGEAMAADRAPRMDNSSCATPEYRSKWKEDDQQGAVTLAVLVGADGKVRESKVTESSGYKSLDKASMQALGKCKYQPGLKEGAAVPAWTKIRYTWIIN